MDHEFFTELPGPGPGGLGLVRPATGRRRGSDALSPAPSGRQLDAASSGTLIDPQGKTRHLKILILSNPHRRLEIPPHQATYPAGWKITIPGAGYHLTLTPTLAGPGNPGRRGRSASPTGKARLISRAQTPTAVNGQGYTELTGYAGELGGCFRGIVIRDAVISSDQWEDLGLGVGEG